MSTPNNIKLIDAFTFEDAEHLAMVAAVNGGRNIRTERAPSQLHIYDSGTDSLLAVVTVEDPTQ